MAGGESDALQLLGAYESSSDSERDSGYTSEEDKKRKHGSLLVDNPIKYKRRRVEDFPMDEEMIVDSQEQDRIPLPRITTIHLDNRTYLQNYNKLATVSSYSTSVFKTSSVISLPRELAVEGPSRLDDSSKHQGRQRSFPHDPGNWAAVFYLPLNETTSCGEGITSYDTLQSLVSDTVKLCHIHHLHLTPSTDFHISLSKTLLLRLHMLQPLADDVRTALASLMRFSVWLDRFEVYVNEEKSRTFLGLRVMNGHSSLAQVVSKLDRLLTTYNLPTFYKECNLHASVAWVLGDQSAALRSLVPVLEDHFNDYFTDSQHLRSFHAKHLHFKAGNRIHTLQLGPYSS